MSAAEPTGDVREQIARLVELHGITDTPNGELFADRLDDTIRRALEEMRPAFAAQETLRRVGALAEEWGRRQGDVTNYPKPLSWGAGADRLRRALAGES